jgi:hypothetical protein
VPIWIRLALLLLLMRLAAMNDTLPAEGYLQPEAPDPVITNKVICNVWCELIDQAVGNVLSHDKSKY